MNDRLNYRTHIYMLEQVEFAWASEQRPELFGAYDAVNAAIAAANGETFGTPI